MAKNFLIVGDKCTFRFIMPKYPQYVEPRKNYTKTHKLSKVKDKNRILKAQCKHIRYMKIYEYIKSPMKVCS